MQAETLAPEELAGHELPEGTYTIGSWANVLLCDLLDVPDPPDGTAHPIFAYIATQCGIGIDVDGILALAGARAESGVMIASCDLRLLQPLRVGASYRVSGAIVGIERKQGRRTGPFDLLTFELGMSERESGIEAARVTNGWVLPKGGDDA